MDTRPFRLRGDERSSSDQSCDTVIQIDSDGLIHSKAAPRLAHPEFVPIIPSLHPNKADLDDPEFTALLQELLRIPQLGEKKADDTVQAAGRKQPERDCLKCDTFAELQERLGCIDGSEITMDMLRSSLKGASNNNITTKSQPQKETGKQTDTEASKARQTLFNQGSGCTQHSVGENQTDGAFPGDSFQREDSGLYDCEECSANSSSEELLNQTMGLNMASLSEGLNTQSKAVTNSVALQGSGNQESPEAADWFKPDKRTSPVGKSSPTLPSPLSSCSSSHSLAKTVILGDVLPNRPTEDVKAMKATITVTVQQPLDLKGQDELVFSMVEEVTISGAYERGRTGGNIICIKDQSQANIQGSANCQPIRIISNVNEESATATSSETNSSVQPEATNASSEKPHNQFRREKRFLPSFINPMLINTDVECELDCAKEKEHSQETFAEVKSRNNVKCPDDSNNPERRSGAHPKKPDRACFSSFSHGRVVLEDFGLCTKHAENTACEKRPCNADKSHPRDNEHVFSSPRVSEVGEGACSHVGNTPKRAGVSPGCQETNLASSKTGSLPRGWQNASYRDSTRGCHMVEDHRDPRGVTSSTPCSPGVTLERRQGRQHSSAHHSIDNSSPRKHGTEFKQDSTGALRKGTGSLFKTSGLTIKHGTTGGGIMSPLEDSGRLFSAKLEQLASKTNSLGRTPRDLPTLERGSSNTSMSSKGSIEGACRAAYKGNYEGDCTFPRASRSPRKNPRCDQSQHFFPSEKPVIHSARHSKLSAVGKLKMATPKVRRLSAPSIKNLNLSHKNLQQSINRSASLSPDSKTVSFERTSSFFSSSPPRSFHSISRTPSQSSTCSSTKSAIKGFVNGRISDLLKEKPSSPTSGGPDQMAALPSPYSQLTSPRTPDHMSGHASDTTSVLSGDLPPAMGKTSLHFSNRNSLVSSGYDSMVRDSEATGSSTSNRDSVSDRSGSLLSVARSSRSSRRRGSTGKTPGLTGFL